MPDSCSEPQKPLVEHLKIAQLVWGVKQKNYPKKLSAIYVAMSFREEGMIRKFLVLTFNKRTVCLNKKSVQLVNSFDSFKYVIHIFQF